MRGWKVAVGLALATWGCGGDAADVACTSSSVSIRRYDAARKCVGPAEAVDGCVVLPSPRAKGVGAICGLAPDGGVYAAVTMDHATVTATGWTFAGATGSTLDGTDLTTEEQQRCASVLDAVPLTPCP